MSVIIEEFEARVESDRPREAGVEGVVPAPENQHGQAMIDVLELIQERKARLAVD